MWKNRFFKYYTAESAKLTLMHTTRKWSSPLLFNDPFDNQFDLHLEEPTDEIARACLDQYLSLLTSSACIEENQFGTQTPLVQFLHQTKANYPDFKYTEEDIAYLLEGVKEGMRNARQTSPEVSAEVRRIMGDSSVFCASETHDNLLMWSHYAQNHTGAVIEFLALPEVDSPLMAAKPVNYLPRMPRLTFSTLMDYNLLRKTVYDTITLTKGDVWSYEKEWRIVTALRDKSLAYEILPYAPEEVGAVYLGCRMTENDRTEVVGVTGWKYPNAKIYSSSVSDREFVLVFNELP